MHVDARVCFVWIAHTTRIIVLCWFVFRFVWRLKRCENGRGVAVPLHLALYCRRKESYYLHKPVNRTVSCCNTSHRKIGQFCDEAGRVVHATATQHNGNAA